MRRKILVSLLVVVLVLSLVCPTLAASIVDSGTCGEHLTWRLYSDGTITINGSGPMTNYTWDTGGPWFQSSTDIKQVVINEGVTSVGDYAFYKPWHLVKSITKITLPESCTRIGESAFSGCCNVSQITIPKNVTYVGISAFSLCESLTSIKIPDKVTVLKTGLFGGCSKLSTVYISNNITSIESWAFSNCLNLKHIYYDGTKAEWQEINISKEYNDPLFSATIHYSSNPTPPPAPVDAPSSWAEAEVKAAIKKGLVPEDAQKNYQKPISRLETTKFVVTLLEQSSGKTIDEIMAEKGVSPDPSAFTDTTDPTVLAVNALDIIRGVGDNKFSPEGTLTRAQIAAIINRVANVLNVNTADYTHEFTDVSGHWVDSELGWPSSTGIIKGVSKTKFAPDNNLTKEQAIVLTYRTLKVYTSRYLPSNWAKQEVYAATEQGLVPSNLQQDYTKTISRNDVLQMVVTLLEQSSGKTIDEIMAEKGVSPDPSAFTDTTDPTVLAVNALDIIRGVGDNKFSPEGTLTRAQIAAIINRVANVLNVNTADYTHEFTDVSGHWVDSELGWPSSTGIIKGTGDNKFSPNKQLTTEQAIVAIYRTFQVLTA